MTRGGVRAVQGALLQSMCRGNSIVGPNPAITAIQTSLLVLSVVLPHEKWAGHRKPMTR